MLTSGWTLWPDIAETIHRGVGFGALGFGRCRFVSSGMWPTVTGMWAAVA